MVNFNSNFDIANANNNNNSGTGYSFTNTLDPTTIGQNAANYLNQMGNWGNTSNINGFSQANVGLVNGVAPDTFSKNSLFGFTDDNGQKVAGSLQTGFGALSGLMSMWSGYNAAQLAQKQYQLQKDAFNANIAAQKKTYNNSLTNEYNRSTARGQSNTGGMTASEYVSKYGM